jgi:hypothetical protein
LPGSTAHADRETPSAISIQKNIEELSQQLSDFSVQFPQLKESLRAAEGNLSRAAEQMDERAARLQFTLESFVRKGGGAVGQSADQGTAILPNNNNQLAAHNDVDGAYPNSVLQDSENSYVLRHGATADGMDVDGAAAPAATLLGRMKAEINTINEAYLSLPPPTTEAEFLPQEAETLRPVRTLFALA